MREIPRREVCQVHYTYHPQGVCCREFCFSVEDGILTDLTVTGGCSGNLQGICKLVEGMPVDRVIDCLAGTPCGDKPTSCPDQLARALAELK
ncbi:MAG: TIGR03905 family TSCPD domain-containing protein [Oscillospiraceae bacterium]|nr:TIGR03905 family TSCPD domain-containing protein [Oscillospiraceae bacterium]